MVFRIHYFQEEFSFYIAGTQKMAFVAQSVRKLYTNTFPYGPYGPSSRLNLRRWTASYSTIMDHTFLLQGFIRNKSTNQMTMSNFKSVGYNFIKE